MTQYQFDTVDQIQIQMLDELFSQGQYVTTRNQTTLEICNVNFCLNNPRNRITFNKKRKWKLPLAIGEFAWHISGSNSVDFIAYYAKQWENFSTDGRTISESCYGYKIFEENNLKESQWRRLIKLLRMDKFSRRAVLDFYDSYNGIDYFAKDIACVCTIQFLIRNERLDTIVNMRSNDIIWGLPYDIYFFTMLQELLSLELNVEMGKYYHNVASMHIYEQHYELGKRMLEERDATTEGKVMLHMTDLNEINTFLSYEEKIRTQSVSAVEVENLMIDTYWRDLLKHLMDYKNNKVIK